MVRPCTDKGSRRSPPRAPEHCLSTTNPNETNAKQHKRPQATDTAVGGWGVRSAGGDAPAAEPRDASDAMDARIAKSGKRERQPELD